MNYSNSQDEAKQEDDKPQDERETAIYWNKWIKSAKDGKYAKRHRSESREAWIEYERETEILDTDGDRPKRSYPIYWSSSKTLEPAYYARQPQPRAKRKFGIKDFLAMKASKLAENQAEYRIDENYDEAMLKGVGDFIHADRACLQVIYKADEKKERKTLSEAEDGGYFDDSNQAYEGEVFEDKDGIFYEKNTTENQKVYIAPLCYDEIIHTPDAKCWSEIQEIGIYFTMPKDEALEAFDEEITKSISFKSGSKDNKDSAKESDKAVCTADYLDGWEIWCKKTKKIYIYSPDCCPNKLLDIKEDTWQLAGFFPVTKFIIGSRPSKHLYPTPAYIHLKETIDQLHQAYNKVFDLITGLERKALVDGSFPELLEVFDSMTQGEFIVVKNLEKIVEKVGGDMSKLIWYIPTGELVTAITELTQLDDFFNNKFNEFFGIPDILRGVGDPVETARAQAIQAGAAHDRFRWQKAQVQAMAREAIELMIDLDFKVLPDDVLWRTTGAQYVLSDVPPEQQQQVFMQCLELLRNDKERIIRIDIKTDSTSFADEMADNQNANTVAQTLVGGLDKVSAMLAAGQPEFAAIAMDATLLSLESLKDGDEHIENFKNRTEQLIQKMMQPPPQQPPPPDYEAMKLELKNKELDIKMMQVQIKQYETELKAQSEETKTIIKQLEQQFDQQMEARQQEFTEWLQANYLKLDDYKAQVQGAESAAEETRLAKETDIEGKARVIEAFKPAEQQAPQPTQLHITVQSAPAPATRKIMTPVRDANGLMQSMAIEEIAIE